MRRVAIIGNAGGGKSVLARKLGNTLNIPVYQFDDLQWRPGWMRTPEAEIHEVHAGWLAGTGWIIDGWGSWDLLEQRFAAADTIIFVDFRIVMHYWWAAKRQVKAVLNINTGWPPEGCAALPVTMRLFKLMWRIHQEMRLQLVKLIDRYANDTYIVHLKSPADMRVFLRELERTDWRTS